MSLSPSLARVSAHAAAPPVRIMVVDDSSVVRKMLTRWFEEAGGLEVVASHMNGRRAIDDIERSFPDVVVLDIEMPDMDGLTALPLILERKPGLPVIVASSFSRRGAEVSLKALTLGAADYLTKPDAGEVAGGERFREDLIGKVRALAARGSVREGVRRKPAIAAAPAAPPRAFAASAAKPVTRPMSAKPVRAVLIGSSTGGPQALTKLFAELGPAIADVPVLVTQHMPATFTAILADHIGRASNRPASEGQDGEVVQPGHIYVAPGGRHMVLVKSGAALQIKLLDTAPVNFCKPAVDPLFMSAAEIYGSGALAIVLTGMGSDGAKGATALADAGASVIVQDEATSVVWGMPGAVVAAKAYSEILPLDQIGPRVSRFLSRGSV